jgi:hypothetical protein
VRDSSSNFLRGKLVENCNEEKRLPIRPADRLVQPRKTDRNFVLQCSRTPTARFRRSVAEAIDLASGKGIPGYSCGTAPDLHRLRHYALASGPQGTPAAYPLTEEEFIRTRLESN